MTIPEVYDAVMREYVHTRCKNGVWCPDGSEYLVPHTIDQTDKFGQWHRDLFYGLMRIVIKPTPLEGSSLPISWKTEKSKVCFYQKQNLNSFSFYLLSFFFLVKKLYNRKKEKLPPPATRSRRIERNEQPRF